MKKSHWIVGGVFGSVILAAVSLMGTHSSVQSANVIQSPTTVDTQEIEQKLDAINSRTAQLKTLETKEIETDTPIVQKQQSVSSESNLSNDNHYTNVDGNIVHSPSYSSDNSVPAGASAECRDGTYSFSQHRSGTCSHHGGVARWL